MSIYYEVLFGELTIVKLHIEKAWPGRRKTVEGISLIYPCVSMARHDVYYYNLEMGKVKNVK